MQRVLSSAVGAPVTIKGNRAERLGAIGRGEGILCFATALIRTKHRRSPHEPSTEQRIGQGIGQGRPGKRLGQTSGSAVPAAVIGVGQAVGCVERRASARDPRADGDRRGPRGRPAAGRRRVRDEPACRAAHGSAVGCGGGAKGLGGRQVEGRQAVRELLMAERRKIHEIWVSAELEGDSGVADIVEIAAARRVPLRYVAKGKLEHEARTDAPQGVLALAAEIPEADLGDLIRGNGKTKPFLVAVDGVTDPGNLGAIIRSCDAAGVTGSAAAAPSLRAHHADGVQGLGRGDRVRADGAGSRSADDAEAAQGPRRLDRRARRRRRPGPVRDRQAGRPMRCAWCSVPRVPGIARLTRERCDTVVSIPMLGRVSSLNVSVAAAVALFEVTRARRRHVVAFACIDVPPIGSPFSLHPGNPPMRAVHERTVRTSSVHRRHRRGVGGGDDVVTQVAAVEPGASYSTSLAPQRLCDTRSRPDPSSWISATNVWMRTPSGSASPVSGPSPPMVSPRC